MSLLSEALCVPSNCGIIYSALMYISQLFEPLSSDICTFGVSSLSYTFIALSCTFIAAAA